MPGRNAEQSREFLKHFTTTPVPAAVLVPLIERDDELTVLLDPAGHAAQESRRADQLSRRPRRAER